jgi:hypothetical protein
MEQMNNNHTNEDTAQDASSGAPQEDGGSGRSKKRRILSNILLVLSVCLFLGGVWMLLKEYVIPAKTEYIPPTVSATPYIPPTPAPTPQASASPTPAPTPYNLIPLRISFPTFEQTCEIQPVGRTEDGAMGTVDSNIIAAWYEEGPSPGDYGNALINGHKSWKKEKGVFAELVTLKLGDRIVIFMDDGSELNFYVHTVDVYDRLSVPESVMDLDRGAEPRITLITCIGDWDYGAGTSSERVVVTAKLYPPEAAASPTPVQ